MPAAEFELDLTMPMSFPLRMATLLAASITGAHVIAVSRDDPMLRIKFDRDISQALICDLLELFLATSREFKYPEGHLGVGGE